MIFRIIVVRLLRRFRWNFKDVVLMCYMRVLGKKGHRLLGNMLRNIKELKLDIQEFIKIKIIIIYRIIIHQEEDHTRIETIQTTTTIIIITNTRMKMKIKTNTIIIDIINIFNKHNNIVIHHHHQWQHVVIVEIKNNQIHNNMGMYKNCLILIWRFHKVYILIKLYQ